MDILSDPEIIELAIEAGLNEEKTQEIANSIEENGYDTEYLKRYLKKKANLPSQDELDKIDAIADEYDEYLQKQSEQHEESQSFINVFEYPDSVDWDYIYRDRFNGLPDNIVITDKNNPDKKIRFYDKIQTGPTHYFVVDLEKNICEIVRLKKVKNDGVEIWAETGKKRQASFAISNLKIYQAIPEIHTTEVYSFNLITRGDQKNRINSKTVDECVGVIKTRGLFESTSKATDAFNRIIKCLRNCEEYKQEIKPSKHGFFLIKDKLVSRRDFDNLPSKENINTALEKLEEFGDQYGEIKRVFGYMIHYHIMAPFNYALKQYHGKNLIATMPYILFYGTSRLGKDTIAFFGSFIWRRELNEWSKGQIHSEAQLGEALSDGTYPVVVSEGENILLSEERKGFASIIKDAAESLNVRRKMINSVQTIIPSLSPMIITSNKKTIDTASLSERVGLFDYGTGKRRSKKERKAFERRFSPRQLDGPLQEVGCIGDYIGYKMMSDPQKIREDWFETSVKFLDEIYQYAGRTMPEWIKNPEQPQRLEEGFQREDENYIENILSYIIRDVRLVPKTGKEVYDDERGNQVIENIEIPVTRKDKAEYVVNRNHYPWIFRRTIKGNRNEEFNGDFVYISKSIETDLYRDLGYNIGLEKIADLLDGEHKRKEVSTTDGKKSKKWYAIFRYEDFLKLYGEIGEDIEE